ncbi:MAG: ATP-binding protein [Anaerolineae bacterium]
MSSSTHIVEQINDLLEQSIEFHIKDAIQAMKLCQKANTLVQKLDASNHQFVQAQANINACLSWLYQNDLEYDLALKLGHAAFSELEKLPDKRYFPHGAGALGIAYFRLGDHEQSLHYYLKQLEISEQLQDKWNIARAHLGIALVISRTKDYELALQHNNLALKLYRELGDIERQVSIINNMCFDALDQQMFTAALQFGLMGLDLNLSEQIYGETLIFLHSKIHRAYLGLGQIDQAKNHLDIANQLVAKESNRFLQSLIIRERSRFAQHLGHVTEAIAGFQRLVELTEDPFITAFQEEAHLGLYTLFKQTGEVSAALRHHEKYHAAVIKELHNQAIVKLNLLTTKHQIEKEQKEAEILRQQSVELKRLVNAQTEQLHNSLTREKQLAQNLRRSLDQTEKLNQLKSRVIEVVSHEFRTPLAAINSSATLVGTYLSKLSDAQRDKHVAIIQQSIVNLTSLIRDVESVGESKAGNLATITESMPLSDFCTSLSDNLKQVEKELGISGRFVISFETMPDSKVIHTDPITVEKITELLLSNAFKFSQHQVQGCFAVVANKLVIELSDQGIGIPIKERGQIFELFERGSNAGTIRGLGVGLYLAKQLAEIIDAKIGVESAGVNQGAKFMLELPLNEASV